MRLYFVLSMALMAYACSAQDRHPRRATYYPAYRTNLVRDFSGNGNTATNYGVDLYETSSGWVGEFDGVADYLLTPVQKDYGITDSVTLRVVCKSFENAYEYKTAAGYLAEEGAIDSVIVIGLTSTSSLFPRFEVRANNGGGGLIYSVYATTLVYDVKADLVGVLDRQDASIKFYVDGILQGSQTIPSSWEFNSSGFPFSIGALNLRGTIGQFSDVEIFVSEIYNQALTSNDVYTISTGGTITNEPTAQWTMQPRYAQ